MIIVELDCALFSLYIIGCNCKGDIELVNSLVLHTRVFKVKCNLGRKCHRRQQSLCETVNYGGSYHYSSNVISSYSS